MRRRQLGKAFKISGISTTKCLISLDLSKGTDHRTLQNQSKTLDKIALNLCKVIRSCSQKQLAR